MTSHWPLSLRSNINNVRGNVTNSAEGGATDKAARRRASLDWWHESDVSRQLVCWFKSQWKQAKRWRREGSRFSYDIHSYSQNFDDGFLDDCHSPCVP
uniref:Uncharacterized protein n=1 Tax=Nelumbo nucifera TaxID=4432 RepID=A0A822XK03_NELNU|nr:TPA_asm: hypothetical protein HUJ06_021496 [Nelumbo nucifera]